ncbi:MAG: hypothetical protein BWY57_03137 [Betaproteobacteria bacterium ADurb.Bin341]|nr:MAG: hypothetical protein BWY57_03137 [Betaproteobacteria bacterium ADurb.Bin341]
MPNPPRQRDAPPEIIGDTHGFRWSIVLKTGSNHKNTQ